MKTKKGFTLIELMVVMAIIAILSVLIVGAIQAARKQATNTQRTGNVKTIETALEARAAKCGGNYFGAGGSCAALNYDTDATYPTQLQKLVSQLSPTYITNPLSFDNVGQGYSLTINGNGYELKAYDKDKYNGVPAAQGPAEVIYTASR